MNASVIQITSWRPFQTSTHVRLMICHEIIDSGPIPIEKNFKDGCYARDLTQIKHQDGRQERQVHVIGVLCVTPLQWTRLISEAPYFPT